MVNKAPFFYTGMYRKLRHDGGSTIDNLFTARAQVASRRSRLVCGQNAAATWAGVFSRSSLTPGVGDDLNTWH